jgi:hypothetical protein
MLERARAWVDDNHDDDADARWFPNPFCEGPAPWWSAPSSAAPRCLLDARVEARETDAREATDAFGSSPFPGNTANRVLLGSTPSKLLKPCIGATCSTLNATSAQASAALAGKLILSCGRARRAPARDYQPPRRARCTRRLLPAPSSARPSPPPGVARCAGAYRTTAALLRSSWQQSCSGAAAILGLVAGFVHTTHALAILGLVAGFVHRRTPTTSMASLRRARLRVVF